MKYALWYIYIIGIYKCEIIYEVQVAFVCIFAHWICIYNHFNIAKIKYYSHMYMAEINIFRHLFI